MPSAIQAMSRRYEFWKTPDDLQNAADRMGYLTVVRQWSWKGSDLICRYSVKLAISLSVGFLDCLHDPSAYVTPHDISDVVIPVHKHPLTAPRILSESRK